MCGYLLALLPFDFAVASCSSRASAPPASPPPARSPASLPTPLPPLFAAPYSKTRSPHTVSCPGLFWPAPVPAIPAAPAANSPSHQPLKLCFRKLHQLPPYLMFLRLHLAQRLRMIVLQHERNRRRQFLHLLRPLLNACNKYPQQFHVHRPQRPRIRPRPRSSPSIPPSPPPSSLLPRP